MKLKFTFAVIASPKDEKTNVIAITCIMTEDSKGYVLPEDSMYAGLHKELVKTNTYSKVKASLKKRHDRISVWFTLTEELKNVYMDEEHNLQFEDRFLQEINDSDNKNMESTDLVKILEKLVETTQKNKTEKNLKHIADKLILEKFNTKSSNVHQWIDIYEKECTRLQVVEEENKIEIMRFFLDEPSMNWYNSTMLKSRDNDWNAWKEEFVETFANKGWNSRAYAHYYKYKDGSLLEYAIKKERLLLEINKEMDIDTMIDRVGFGLPESVREKIDRENIKSITDLFHELKKQEGRIEKRNNIKTRESQQKWQNKIENKKPCKICESLNKKDRYHPEDKCWFKTKPNEIKEKQRNINNNEVIEVNLQDETKNE